MREGQSESDERRLTRTAPEKEEEMEAHTVLALLDNAEHAAKVIHALQEAGFSERSSGRLPAPWSVPG